MRPARHLRLTAAAGATATVLAASPSALAADAVFGGRSASGDPIVLNADPKAATLRSVVVSWRARCEDGSNFAAAGPLTPAEAVPGFAPAATELLVARNAKGRFEGTQLAARDLGSAAGVIKVELEGKLKPARAAGTLAATVTIVDKATGVPAMTCTARQRWTAARAPGVVYGGTTSQGEPFVARLDSARKIVNDIIVTWRAPCSQGGYFRVPDQFGGFAIKRSGGFGNPFDADFPIDGGGQRRFDYALSGRFTSKAAKGRLRVTVAETDAAGQPGNACDSGALTWKAATG